MENGRRMFGRATRRREKKTIKKKQREERQVGVKVVRYL